MYARRFWIALLFGFAAGLVCAVTSISGKAGDEKIMIFLSALLNRTLIGFVIGISCWRLGWVLHGIFLGLLVTLSMSIPLIWIPEAGYNVFVLYTVAGVVWGFIIELLATVIFKAPMKK